MWKYGWKNSEIVYVTFSQLITEIFIKFLDISFMCSEALDLWAKNQESHLIPKNFVTSRHNSSQI